MKDRENMRLFHMGCGESLDVSRLARRKWTKSLIFSIVKQDKGNPDSVHQKGDKKHGSGDR